MKILLTGIGGVYNYGCEAIIRGTVQKITERFHDAQIDYASLNLQDDIDRLKDCPLNKIILRRKRWSCRNILRKVLERFGFDSLITLDPISIAKQYDMVFSIGGDIYTIWANGKDYPKHLMHYGDVCEKHGIPYVLWGCSVGPFEKNPSVKEAFCKHLSNISLIVAREEWTLDYLKSMGVSDNVLLSPDPAFSVPAPAKRLNLSEKVEVLGINLSPLSLKYKKISRVDAVNDQAKTIEILIEKMSLKKVILLPHVNSSDINDDDVRYLKDVRNAILRYPEKVEIPSEDLGFIGTKELIVKCDLVIAARMHCGINAVQCDVPTLFLSYTPKAKGMAKFVYKNDLGCFPLENFSCENIDKLIPAINSLPLTIKSPSGKMEDELFDRLLSLLRKRTA